MESISQAESLLSFVPQARVQVVPGAGHWMVLTRAAEVACYLQRFYRAL